MLPGSHLREVAGSYHAPGSSRYFKSVAIPPKNVYFSKAHMPTLEKILIIRFSSIGDIILASPIVRALRRAYPNARIDFLVKSEYAELLQFNNRISSVIRLRSSERS